MGIYYVESFFWALVQLHGSFNDIGAHEDFQKSKFFIPELLLKNYDSAMVDDLFAIQMNDNDDGMIHQDQLTDSTGFFKCLVKRERKNPNIFIVMGMSKFVCNSEICYSYNGNGNIFIYDRADP